MGNSDSSRQSKLQIRQVFVTIGISFISPHEVVASFTSSRTASNLGIERCVKINGLSSGSEAWTGIGVVAGFLAGMGMIESSYMKIHKRPKKFNIIKYYSMLGEL